MGASSDFSVTYDCSMSDCMIWCKWDLWYKPRQIMTSTVFYVRLHNILHFSSLD